MPSSKTTTQTRRLAAIDIGTNSFHLIVADVSPRTGRFRILDREKEIIRLGSGSTDMKYLSASAMDRGVQALLRFRRIADSMSAPIRAIATSAVREALNQDAFLRRVRSETGIRVEIASGSEEARLIHLGVLQSLPLFTRRLLLIDIGGGSTEFLVGRRRTISYTNSLKLGAVRLSQRFFRSGRIDKRSIRECRDFVRGSLAPVARSVDRFALDIAVGSSGTIANLASMIQLRLGGDDDTSLNGVRFSRRQLSEITAEILGATETTARLRIPGLDPSRADIIPAGAIILEQIFQSLGLKHMTVSEYALREGIILDTVEKWHTAVGSRHLSDIRLTSVEHIADLFRIESGHAQQVRKLALRIFDQTTRWHQLGKQERVYLEAAAVLHEAGLFVSHTQHHRHSYYLIRNAELLGFSENEKEIIANVARYHRKSHPKEKHEGFRILAHDEQIVVARLSAILRIADGLDRNHAASVRSIDIRRSGDRMLFRVTPKAARPLDLEIWGAERKKQLFEEVFGVRVSIAAVS
ncbi:MAG: Ppx/GppA family phosphatase [Bacteroidetes bacterium]|nr:Ppx/GppA family phosphatase [Bacteroidota bacterium]